LHLGAISGCALFPEKVVVKQKNLYLPIICPDPPKITPIVTNKLEPRAIIDKAGLSWVGLTPQHYQNLALNTQETIRFIKGQNGTIKYYRSCIMDFNLKIEELKNAETPPDDPS
jgi:hypothetical protein